MPDFTQKGLSGNFIVGNPGHVVTDRQTEKQIDRQRDSVRLIDLPVQ